MLAMSVEQATQNFLEKGDQIAKDSQDLKEELIAAVEDVRKQGNSNSSSASFALTAIDRAGDAPECPFSLSSFAGLCV